MQRVPAERALSQCSGAVGMKERKMNRSLFGTFLFLVLATMVFPPILQGQTIPQSQVQVGTDLDADERAAVAFCGVCAGLGLLIPLVALGVSIGIAVWVY